MHFLCNYILVPRLNAASLASLNLYEIFEIEIFLIEILKTITADKIMKNIKIIQQIHDLPTVHMTTLEELNNYTGI